MNLNMEKEMKRFAMIIVVVLAGIAVNGCGESRETRENIARQTRLAEEAEARRKAAEAEKQRAIEEQIKFQEEVGRQYGERIKKTYGDK